MNRTMISLICLFSACAFAEEAAAPVKANVAQQVLEASEAFGKLTALHLKSMESMGLKFNADVVIQGLKDALQGRTELKSEMEYIQVLAAVQEAAFKEAAEENLKKADEFLAKNKSEAGVKVLEANKLQYRIVKEGSGPAVDDKSAPLVRYSAKSLDGSLSEAPQEDIRFDLSEEEMIPGFKLALIGMKEGEKRTVFIHPELAFGTKTGPKSLLTFEIEVVKANAPLEKPLDSLSTPPLSKDNPEIAQPFEDPKAVR